MSVIALAGKVGFLPLVVTILAERPEKIKDYSRKNTEILTG
ncbi:MAG: hypothetical protein ACFFCW_38920 [Candidatus Hodarchaeota archaeon]